MSRSHTTTSKNSTPTANRLNGRRGGLGRKRPRSTLEWEFGREREAAPPAAATARRNGRVAPGHEPYRPPRSAVPPANSPAKGPALQGEIVLSEREPGQTRPGRATQTAAAERGPGTTSFAATSSTLVALFQGEGGLRRVIATRIALDEALDRWWTNADLAPLPLLRDGLLLLEAGHTLDETQRSFLLRSALRTQRGLFTALHHQTDPDRTAFLLKDALLDLHHPFPPQLLPQLCKEDAQSAVWSDYLTHDLAYEATVATGQRSQLAANALAVFQGKPVQAVYPGGAQLRALAAGRNPTLTPLSHRWSLRWLVWLLLTLLLVFVYGWGEYRPGAAMVNIPAGTYTISDPGRNDPASSDPAGSAFAGAVNQRTVTLAAYAIDRTEVTNRAYRLCWAGGNCLLPTTVPDQTRLDYFTNPAYDNFPVVNVNWAAAQSYCTWVGKTLPSLEQWEVAAAIAPATQRRFRYPWGDRFEARFANSAANPLHDTQAVGSYQPAGNSLWGVADLAGNVAEWTLMPAVTMVDGYVVKGGSFQDDAVDLRTDARREVTLTTAVPWLGFRCVRTN